MKILIQNDMFNIAKRLKNIDSDYFVLFNTKNKKFELHNSAQGKSTYCLTFPFDTLDARAIEHTFKTSVRNSSKIFFEIEETNNKIETAQNEKILDECKCIFKDIYNYSNAHTKDFDVEDIYKNKWI